MLGKAGRVMRSFRAFVTKKYLAEPESVDDSEVPMLIRELVKQPDWAAFVQSRREGAFKVNYISYLNWLLCNF